MSKQDFEFEALLEPAEVAEYLRSIAQGLDNRRINIKCGDEAVDLDVPGSVEFRLVGKIREDEQRIRAQFTLRKSLPPAAPELNIQ